MKRVEQRPGFFGDSAIERMRSALYESKLIGPSVLKGGFAATRGFGVTFTREGVDRLLALVPALAPFLEVTLDLPAANAFYLNLLMVPVGASVAAHEDGTLTTFCGLARAPPVRVSVLYLEAPTKGGALRLRRRIGPATAIAPVRGTLLHFRGDLVHEVAVVEAGLRTSVVLEQYALREEEVSEVPRCHFASEGHFDRVLSAAMRD